MTDKYKGLEPAIERAAVQALAGIPSKPSVSPRQLDLLIAACRLWQRDEVVIPPDVMGLADEHGEALSNAEIDELVDAINLGGAVVEIDATVERTPEEWFDLATELQSQMWTALGKVEHALDIEIDSTQDLADMDFDKLGEDEEDEEPREVTREEESPTYRAALTDAGRGHLLR